MKNECSYIALICRQKESRGVTDMDMSNLIASGNEITIIPFPKFNSLTNNP